MTYYDREAWKNLVETGHKMSFLSVIPFCEECWEAVASISHHCHISFLQVWDFLKSQITTVREK